MNVTPRGFEPDMDRRSGVPTSQIDEVLSRRPADVDGEAAKVLLAGAVEIANERRVPFYAFVSKAYGALEGYADLLKQLDVSIEEFKIMRCEAAIDALGHEIQEEQEESKRIELLKEMIGFRLAAAANQYSDADYQEIAANPPNERYKSILENVSLINAIIIPMIRECRDRVPSIDEILRTLPFQREDKLLGLNQHLMAMPVSGKTLENLASIMKFRVALEQSQQLHPDWKHHIANRPKAI